MTAPKPAGSGPAPEPASPPSDAEAISTSLGPAGSLPPKASELVGMDQPAATRLFGAAAERSEQPPATVWRYKNATCELDLFFYLDLRSGGQDCLRTLLAARGK